MEGIKLGSITLYHADCMEYIRSLPDNAFDLAIVDPPYGIGASRPAKKPNKVKQANGSILSVKDSGYTHKDWDDSIPNADYFKELIRVSKNQIIWGANYFGLTGGMIVWDKLNGESDQFGCEIAYCSMNNRTDIVYYMWAGMIQGVYCGSNIMKAVIQQGNKSKNEKRIHPTQKPVRLYEWLLQNYAKHGDRILDTHLGSGSIAIASSNMGFDLTACENDKEYFDNAVKRIREHQKQQRIF
ncbi:MAG: DNA methyltransferase [Bacteroidales bacterium]